MNLKKYIVSLFIILYVSQNYTDTLLGMHPDGDGNIRGPVDNAAINQDMPIAEQAHDSSNSEQPASDGDHEEITPLLQTSPEQPSGFNFSAPKEITKLTQLDKTQYDHNKSLLEKLSKKIDHNNKILDGDYTSFNKSYDDAWPDVNKINARNQSLPYASRRTVQDMLKYIRKGNTKRTTLLSPKDPAQGKSDCMDTLIDAQLGNVFGRDSGSNEVVIKLTTNAQTNVKSEITADINKEFIGKNDKNNAIDVLLIDKPTAEQALLQAKIITRMSDMLMNKISESQGIKAKFTTNFEDSGQYTSSLKHEGVTTTTTIDEKGNISEQVITIDKDPNDSSSTTITFTSKYTNDKRITKKSSDGTNDTTESDLDTQIVDDYVRTTVTTKQIIKAILYSSKQIAPNFVSLVHIIPHTNIVSLIIASTGIMGMKIFSMTTLGHKTSDPSARSGVNRIMDNTLSDRRGWMSADPNRVFRKGTFWSNLCDKMAGKDGAKETDPEENYYTWIDSIEETFYPKTGGDLKIASNLQLGTHSKTS